MAMSSRRARSETSGHGNCMEVAVPSGLRRGRPGQLQQPREHASDGEPDPRVTKSFRTWIISAVALHCQSTFTELNPSPTPCADLWDVGRLEQRVEVNYSKLRELCLHHLPDTADPASREKSHQRFMSSYQSLLCHNTIRKSTRSANARRRHTCSFPSERTHNIADYTVAIHGRSLRTQTVMDMQFRLKAMLNIVRKLPLQRDEDEVKQLSHHLSHFPGLLPDMSPPVLHGSAARSLLESVPKGGFSLPEKGGVYLILQGSVEKLSQDDTTGKISSTMLHPGDTFGKMEEHFVTKSSYPMYITHETCSLIRITVFDYNKVLQNWCAEDTRERQAVVQSCHLLQHVSPAVLSELAKDIRWETISPNQTLLSEGDTIHRVGFIQSGRCHAWAKVPQTSKPAQVSVGELGPGTCVGELLLLGQEVQPYQVEATTRLRIGWVSASTIRGHEVKKHILPENKMAIPILSKEQLRQKHANELMGLHWSKIKSDILREVMSEQHIQPGQSKWRHTAA